MQMSRILRSPIHVMTVTMAVLLLAACGRSRTSTAERADRADRGTGDIVVAVAWPWSMFGGDIRYGQGLDMALAEINDGGGVLGRKIRLLREDDRASVDEGRLIAQKVSANPDVVAVIGHLQSYVSLPAAPIYDLAGIVMLAPTATAPELTAPGYSRLFRTTYTDRTTGHQMAHFAANRRYRRVAIYYIRNAYGRGLANAFEERASELGLVIPARQSYDPSGEASARTFEAVVTQWKTMELDAVFLAGEVPSAAEFVTTARAHGLAVPILGGDALSTPALLAAGGAAEGIVVAAPFHPDEPREAVRSFVAGFTRRYGAAPDAGAALGYDALRLLAEGIRHAGSSAPDRIAASLRQLDGWPGVTGQFTFTADGELVERALVTTIVRDGAFRYVGPEALVAALPDR